MSLRPNERLQARMVQYKQVVSADDARRRREDNLVEIRKSKREESLLKKRREGSVGAAGAAPGQVPPGAMSLGPQVPTQLDTTSASSKLPMATVSTSTSAATYHFRDVIPGGLRAPRGVGFLPQARWK